MKPLSLVYAIRDWNRIPNDITSILAEGVVTVEQTFPSDFLWGVATSSYQIEGATEVDGRGPSIWDTFSRTPGKVKNGDTGDIACDHYHRYPEDIALLQELGIKAYRFSISWPRLFPNGDSKREERGFDFYNRLINALIEAGIEPMATLYHWDLPQPLEDQGGWANRETAFAFERYAEAAALAFGDRISNWITINEPWCVSWLGYSIGVHAPGKQDFRSAVAASHHTALAHGLASKKIKSLLPQAKVGITVNMTNYINESPDDPSIKSVVQLLDENLNRWWIDAILTGEYPKTLVHTYGDLMSGLVLDGDAGILKCDDDFLGVNYYSDSFVRSPLPEDKPFQESAYLPFPHRANTRIPDRFQSELTDIGWPVTPEGLGDLMERIHRDWPSVQEIYVTENGCAINDGPDELGNINDIRRVNYLRDHLKALQRSIANGAPVRGYFAWSLLDNFEWAEGYEQRFGIVYVDWETQRRTIKASGHEFRKIVESGMVGEFIH